MEDSTLQLMSFLSSAQAGGCQVDDVYRTEFLLQHENDAPILNELGTFKTFDQAINLEQDQDD